MALEYQYVQRVFPKAKSYKDYVKEAMTREPKTYKNATRCPKY